MQPIEPTRWPPSGGPESFTCQPADSCGSRSSECSAADTAPASSSPRPSSSLPRSSRFSSAKSSGSATAGAKFYARTGNIGSAAIESGSNPDPPTYHTDDIMLTITGPAMATLAMNHGPTEISPDVVHIPPVRRRRRGKRRSTSPAAQETDQQVEPPVRDQPPDELGSLRARRRAGARYLVTGGAVWVTLLGMQGSRHGLDVAFDLLLVLAIASVTLVIVVIVRVHRRIRALEEHQTPSLPTIPTEKPRHSTDP